MIGTKNQIITYLLVQKDDTKFEIKEYKEKRGLRANKYYWSLLQELANILQKSKEEIHFLMLKEYGQFDVISVDEKVDLKNYFTYFEKIGSSELNNKTFYHYKVYKESHNMDSKEFSILLNGLVQECKQQGIETLEEKEIKEMIKEL